MSRLRIFPEVSAARADLETTDRGLIEQALGGRGVRFEAWKATRVLDDGAEAGDVLAAYAADIARLRSEGGYQSVDVVRMRPDHPEKDAMRGKFLSEHTHAEDEVRFFVEGSGLFCLHLGDRVALVTCERGDLISVPAGTRHWFDMGPRPAFAAIRLFINPSGWVAQFTGDAIAERFPKYD